MGIHVTSTNVVHEGSTITTNNDFGTWQMSDGSNVDYKDVAADKFCTTDICLLE
jgi:hypothetical protein